MKNLKLTFLLLVLICAVLPAPAADSRTVSDQRLVCNTGYKVPECLQQLAILRATLNRFQVDDLGPWTWVLVKSRDWKPILKALGENTDSPAFTILDKRQTFLEETLFVPVPGRSAELLKAWSLPFKQLLDLAVTHELGHGFCHEPDEARADHFGALLRQGKEAICVRSGKASHSLKSSSKNGENSASNNPRGGKNS